MRWHDEAPVLQEYRGFDVQLGDQASTTIAVTTGWRL
jgi:hypothetical protein